METTITKISNKTGLSKSYICELASGAKGNPTNKTIEKLAAFYGIRPIWSNIKQRLAKLSSRAAA